MSLAGFQENFMHQNKQTKNQWWDLPGGSGAKTPGAPNAEGPGFDSWAGN